MLEALNVLEGVLGDTTLCSGVEVPNTVFILSSTIIRFIKIVVPVLLIIWGMIDFAKSIIAKKEDDIKKYQKAFVSRLISAVAVFLVVVIVQLLVGFLSSVQTEGGSETSDTWSCTKKLINGIDTNNDVTEDDNDDNSIVEEE